MKGLVCRPAPDAGRDDLAASEGADEAEEADRHLMRQHQREPEAAQQNCIVRCNTLMVSWAPQRMQS